MGLLENLKLLFGYNHKYLIFNILNRNIKLKYRKSYLGLFWTVLVPAANALVYYFVFHNVMRVQIPNHLLFLLSGILPWQFFQSAISQSMESLLSNHSLLNKVPIPPHIFPLSEVLSGYMNFVFTLPVLFIIQIAYIGFHPLSMLVLLFFSVLLLAQAYFIGLILSYAFVFFRDLRHLINIFLQIWFYLTPVVYTKEMIPEKFKFVGQLNPVAAIFDAIHTSFVFDQSMNFAQFYVPLAWTGGIFLISYVVFLNYDKNIIEQI